MVGFGIQLSSVAQATSGKQAGRLVSREMRVQCSVFSVQCCGSSCLGNLRNEELKESEWQRQGPAAACTQIDDGDAEGAGSARSRWPKGNVPVGKEVISAKDSEEEARSSCNSRWSTTAQANQRSGSRQGDATARGPVLPSPHCSMTGDASAARTTNLDSGTVAAESGPPSCPFEPSSELVEGLLTVDSCSEPLIMIKRRSTPLAPAIIYGVRVQVPIV